MIQVKTIYDKTGGLEEFDPTDPSNYLFSPTQQQVIKSDLTDKFGKVPSPTEGLKDSLEAINIFQENQDKRQLKKARRIGLEAFGNYALTEPVRQMFLIKLLKMHRIDTLEEDLH